MKNKKTYFKYSVSVKWITAGCLSLIGVLGLMAIVQRDDLVKAYAPSLVHTLLLGIPLLVTLFVLLYFALRAPVYYIHSDEGLYLKLVMGSKFYSDQEYDIMGHISSDDIKGATRIIGSGGYFGYIGRFSVRGRGVYQFYVTNWGGRLIRLVGRQGQRTVYINQ